MGFNDNDGPELGAVDGLPLKDGALLGSEDGLRLKLGVELGEVPGSMDTDGPTLGLIEGNILDLSVGVDDDSEGRELNIVSLLSRGTGARVRLANISGSLVRNSTVEGVLLRNLIGN